MRRVVLLLLRLVPVAGLLGSWAASRPHRLSQQVSRSRINTTGLNQTPAATRGEPPGALVRDLLELFQGEFDNYDQVVDDRNAGMTPGPGGGHEHIHCSLKLLDPSQVPEQVAAGGRGDGDEGEGRAGGIVERPLAVVAAKYYFNGDSNVVFRYRLYSFHTCLLNTPGARGDAVMRLWRLLPPVETRLRAAGYDLKSFDWDARQQHQHEDQKAEGEAKGCNDVAEHILGCEIYWSRRGVGDDIHGRGVAASSRDGSAFVEERGGEGAGVEVGAAESAAATATVAVAASTETPARAAEAAHAAPEGTSFVGLMGEDDSGTWVESQNAAGLEILVKDDLRIWNDHLWVNDRGFNREGNFVYGNQRGVPYKMRRVVAAGPLEWTLAERYRTPELYAAKMSAIGVTPGQRFGPPVVAQRTSAPVGKMKEV